MSVEQAEVVYRITGYIMLVAAFVGGIAGTLAYQFIAATLAGWLS